MTLQLGEMGERPFKFPVWQTMQKTGPSLWHHKLLLSENSPRSAQSCPGDGRGQRVIYPSPPNVTGPGRRLTPEDSGLGVGWSRPCGQKTEGFLGGSLSSPARRKSLRASVTHLVSMTVSACKTQVTPGLSEPR